MLSLYRAGGHGLAGLSDRPVELPADITWIDLLEPSPEEEAQVQQWLGIEVPTREEMREIEASSRIYDDSGALYMTVLSLLNSDSSHPDTTDITFILAGRRLVTVRYASPTPLQRYLQRAPKVGPACRNADFVLVGLLETFVDRIADLLEKAGLDADELSRSVFEPRSDKPMKTADFKKVLAAIGRVGVIASKSSESLITIARVLTYLSATGAVKLSKESKGTIKSLQRDTRQLLDHTSYLTDKITFLLDATTGLINVEQNIIIKIFSVVAVTLMPPTLIASVYGMNFPHMPELAVPWAYPTVLCAMVVSAVLPYLYFKRKGWL